MRKEEREEKGRKWADGDGKERGGKRRNKERTASGVGTVELTVFAKI